MKMPKIRPIFTIEIEIEGILWIPEIESTLYSRFLYLTRPTLLWIILENYLQFMQSFQSTLFGLNVSFNPNEELKIVCRLYFTSFLSIVKQREVATGSISVTNTNEQKVIVLVRLSIDYCKITIKCRQKYSYKE